MNDGIRQRLILLALLPALLLMLLSLGWYGHSSMRHAEAALHDRGMITTRYLLSLGEFAVATGNLIQIHEVASGLINDEIVQLRLYNQHLEEVLRVGDGQVPKLIDGEHPLSEMQRCLSDGEYWLYCAPIYYQPLAIPELLFDNDDPGRQLVGHLELVLSTSELQRKKQQVIGQSLVGVIIMLLLLIYLIRRVEMQITKPLGELTESVSLLSHGVHDVMIREDGRGELLTLQRGFNRMARTLDRHYKELELRVSESTRRLSLALEELEKRNQQLQEQTDKATAASRAKSMFLATMSHEIRTPLSGIVGMLSLLNQDELPDSQRSYLENLGQAAGSLRMLIEDVLDFSRIEAGKMSLRLNPCSPRQSTESVAMTLAISAHEKGLQLMLEVDPAVPRNLLGDETRYRQILINLVGNAIKFTESGHVFIRLQRLDANDPEICLLRTEVIDTGIGIPEDKQAAVFDGFTQIDSSMTRQHGGSGLGTTISRELVQMMGGKIGLHSQEGVGSTFWVELPIKVVQQGPLYQPLARKRFLLLEAYAPARENLVRLLQAMGVVVDACDEAATVLALHARHQYTAVILGERDATFAWHRLAEKLAVQKQTDCQYIHLTFINGMSDAALFNAHLTKPLTESRLLRVFGLAPVPEAEDEPIYAHSPCRILLAEDDRINATVASSFLRQLGHHTTLVTDGEAALEAMAQGGYELVIMDLRMPKLDGLTVTSRWRERELEGHLPIIALTANACDEDREASLKAGMDDFLSKPVTKEQLAKIIARHVRG